MLRLSARLRSFNVCEVSKYLHLCFNFMNKFHSSRWLLATMCDVLSQHGLIIWSDHLVWLVLSWVKCDPCMCVEFCVFACIVVVHDQIAKYRLIVQACWLHNMDEHYFCNMIMHKGWNHEQNRWHYWIDVTSLNTRLLYFIKEDECCFRVPYTRTKGYT